MTADEQQALLDAEHLRLLRVGYLVGAAINGAFALFPWIHITIGIFLIFGHFPDNSGRTDTRLMGWFFVVIGAAFSLLFAALGLLKLTTARRIRERRSKTFCLVVAGLSCLEFPFGIVLGVFTFLLLQRPSIAALFSPVPSS